MTAAPPDVLTVHGGRPLAGSVPISGYKHATVPMLAAVALAGDRVELSNVADIEDRRVLCEIYEELGATVSFDRGRLTIDPRALQVKAIPEASSSRVHGTIYLLPALLGRFGFVEMGSIGGCVFGRRDTHGSRPIHHVTRILEQFGAIIDIDGGLLTARLPLGRYRSAHVSILDYYDDPVARTGPLASGATKAALLAASVAAGCSTIREPLRTPEILEIIRFLRAAGVPIDDRGTELVVEGRAALNGVRYAVMSDPMEAFTYAACAAYCGAAVTINGLTTERLRPALAAELEFLESMGVTSTWEGESALSLTPAEGPLRGADVEVLPQGSIHPDNQPLCSLLLLAADRPCRVVDRVWSTRFSHAQGLSRLGARLEVRDGVLFTYPGRPALPGRDVDCADLRCASVLLVAALTIDGETRLHAASHLHRGYDDVVGRLAGLGADIRAG